MITRKVKRELLNALDKSPAVVLTGPRQIGKTTLAFEVANERNALYLDLERPSDLSKLSDVEQFCNLNQDRLLILDEVQRVPDLFAPLRGIIDERRRKGIKSGHFLLLGSASIELLKQASETLAGRTRHIELSSLDVVEVGGEQQAKLWGRGGFPESFLAEEDQDSFEWRVDFIRTYLERDIPQLGPRIPAETLRRFWTMLAHNQGQGFNAAAFAKGLDVKGVTTSRYLDLMVDLLLVRRLQPWVSNLGRRLVKAPKTYIRDSGICHALLGIEQTNDLLGHPVVGGSWEGFVIESILNRIPKQATYGYYRTTGGAEVDLVVEMGAGEVWAIEVKYSTAPTLSRGFYSACEDLQPTHKYVVHSCEARFPLGKGVEAISLSALLGLL
ncbi:MAG: ATP-binding protein [Gammaproteobacteria bacterium]|uniref:ATP-binding protein n=1 Tax=Candidatus Thiopontia autotrophica TaxID=2841688 RepID=A0A8J6P6X2_9GAMM|nr:ATP-binding protein [Candidatus Thiopontia autotrophica]MBL6985340.1 ATP-binding protein [Candidatus Thioglobus sp.]